MPIFLNTQIRTKVLKTHFAAMLLTFARGRAARCGGKINAVGFSLGDFYERMGTVMNNKDKRHDEFFSDDGIFAVKERTYYEYSEKCCFCGYELLCGESVLALNNGDVIHESCWCDYAEENVDSFASRFIYTDGNEG